MNCSISSRVASVLRDGIQAVGYSDDWLSKTLDTKVAPTPHSDRLADMFGKLREDTPANLLARLFFLGQKVADSLVRSSFSNEFIEALAASELAHLVGSDWRPAALLIPCEDLLIASDLYLVAESATPFDHVLAVNYPARHLMLYSDRSDSRSTLDLCCGSGVQALKAASYSQKVIATDLNARAIEYAKFNAALNGVDGIEWLVGDGVSPVSQRRFERIICNPPFVITPSQRYMYSDNTCELDLFCRQLVQSATQLLHMGGTLQLICEWVQIGAVNWGDRIKEWFDETGCDVWVVKANTQFPKSYAETRSLERPKCEASAAEAQIWAQYLEERGVVAVHGGLITAIKSERSSPWFKATELTGTPEVPYGEIITQRLKNFEYIARNPSLERCRFVLSDQVQMQQTGRWRSVGWAIESIVLNQTSGLANPIGMNTDMFSFVSEFNGERTVGDLGVLLAEKHQLPPEIGYQECEKLCRHLLDNGYLTPVDETRSRVDIR